MERGSIIGNMLNLINPFSGSNKLLESLARHDPKGPAMAYRSYAIGGRKGRHLCASNARKARRQTKARRRHRN